MVFTVVFYEYLIQFALLLLINIFVGFALTIYYSNEYLYLFLQAYFFYLETNNILVTSLQSFFLFKIIFSVVVFIFVFLLSSIVFFLILGKVSLRRVLFNRLISLFALLLIGIFFINFSFYSSVPYAIGLFSRLLPEYYYAYFFVIDLSVVGWSEFAVYILVFLLFLLITFLIFLVSSLYLEPKNLAFLKILFLLIFITFVVIFLPADTILHLIFVIVAFTVVEFSIFLGLLIKEYCKIGRVA